MVSVRHSGIYLRIQTGVHSNDALVAIAPTVATSLLAYNVSCGIEPVNNFASYDEVPPSYAERRFRELRGHDALPSFFVSGRDVTPQERFEMYATIQRQVDAPLGSVINCPPDLPFEDFEQLCRGAYAIGASGCGFFGCNRQDDRPTRLDMPSAPGLANSAVMSIEN